MGFPAVKYRGECKPAEMEWELSDQPVPRPLRC